MQKLFRVARKSPIIIGEVDHERLSLLAETIAGRNEALADQFTFELDRARVVPEQRVPATVIRMGSTATWKTGAEEVHRATLVFPGEADFADGKLSVLTPVGVALIGLSVGQEMEWMARDGRTHALTVLEVQAPEGVAV